MIKRGQVTIFIIIAVLIIAAVGGIVFIENIKKAAESPEVKEVSGFVSDCLQQTSEDAVITIGDQGGYYNIPERANYFLFFPKPYYIYETQNFVPIKATLEKELGSYIEDNIDICLDDFEALTRQGYTIKKAGSNKATVRIDGRSNTVSVSAKVPVSVSKGNTTNLVTDFSAGVMPVRFETLLKASSDIAKSETIDPRTICITCIQEIAQNYSLQVTITDTDDRNEFIYTLIDEQSNFTGLPFEYSFAARYKFPDCADVESCAKALG